MRQSLKTLSRRPNTQVAVSLGTGSVLLVGSNTTTNHSESLASSSNHARLPPGSSTNDEALTAAQAENNRAVSPLRNNQLHTRGLVQLRVLGSAEDSVDTQETSCYVLEGSNS